MKKRRLVWALPIGLLIAGIYYLAKRFCADVPDIVAYPMLIASVACILTGLLSYGYYHK